MRVSILESRTQYHCYFTTKRQRYSHLPFQEVTLAPAAGSAWTTLATEAGRPGSRGIRGWQGATPWTPATPSWPPPPPCWTLPLVTPMRMPRGETLDNFFILFFNSLFAESWCPRAVTAWAPPWPGWGRVTTNTTSPSRRRSEPGELIREERFLFYHWGGHGSAADFFIKFLDSVPSVYRDKSHHSSHLLRRLRRPTFYEHVVIK